MSPAALPDAFDTLAEAPDAVKRLRELVLQLAVQGRLVAQDPADEPAGALLERIRAQAGAGARSRVEVDFEGDLPWESPSSWVWVYLGEAMGLVNGRAFKPSEWSKRGLPIVRIQNLNDPDAPFNYCDFDVPEKSKIGTGDLLLSWSGTPGTSFGAFIWRGPRAVLNQHIFRCEPRGNAFASEFLRLAINSRLAEMIDRAHGGVGLRHVTRGKLDGLWLPLPPLAEQHRIVAKVDEWMGLLDRFEAARTARETTRRAARDAALAALAGATSPEGVSVAWQRLAAHLDELIADPADIAPLRQTVLQLAVQGRLVAQDPADEPAGALLERIAAEKARLVAAGQFRKEKPLPPVSAAEAPFALPAGWVWTRVGLVCDVVGGVTKGRRLDGLETVEVPYLRVANVQAGRLVLSPVKTIEIPAEELDWYRLLAGDVLLTEGGDWDKLGRSAVWEGAIQDCIHQNHIFRARPLAGTILPQWLSNFTNSFHGRSYFQSCAKQTTNLASINMTQLTSCPLPLPPLAEQHRIVAKVDELLALLDALEARLTAARAAQAAFAAAAVQAAAA